MPPAMEAWSLNHWTTREVPGLYVFLIVLKFSIRKNVIVGSFLLALNIRQEERHLNDSKGHWGMLWFKCLCFPPNSYVEILMPKVMVFGDGAFGK